jgi:hypothetical protein
MSAKQAAILRYDGTAARWQVIARGAGAAATKSQQQAGADNTVAVTPAHQQDHDSAAKAWGYFTQSGGTYTLSAGYNIASISKNSTGNLTIGFTTPFASTSFAVVATVNQFGGVGTTETVQLFIQRDACHHRDGHRRQRDQSRHQYRRLRSSVNLRKASDAKSRQ